MKKYTETIKMELPVNRIAQKLLATIEETNPFRELITETIIGITLENGGITMLYDALYGYEVEIDIKEGKLYAIKTESISCYMEDKTSLFGKFAKVDETDLYRFVRVLEVAKYRITSRNKIRIEAKYLHKNGEEQITTDWIRQEDLFEITEDFKPVTPVVVGSNTNSDLLNE